MSRSVRVVLIGQAKEDFEALNKVVGEQSLEGKANSEEMQLLKSIKNKIEILKLNPDYGDNIPKRLIPKEYVEKYNVTTLFRLEIAHYWRMLYTIRGDQIEIVCFILDMIDHKTYNKKFGYKG
ncbi:MAG TPA: hypothetical protein VJA47_01050 [archaeon]|nr:hypothetical protein [archaeon]